MALLFLTGNRNKYEEARAIIPGLEMLDIDLPEIQSDDARVIIEAKLAQAMIGRNDELIVEDTSLYLDALNGFPGPLVKWFMKAVGLAGMVEIAAARGNVKATAKCLVGYARSGVSHRYFEGTVDGTVVTPRGSRSFGWDAIFLPDGSDETFAEMPPEEKARTSHRRKAMEALGYFSNDSSAGVLTTSIARLRNPLSASEEISGTNRYTIHTKSY